MTRTHNATTYNATLDHNIVTLHGLGGFELLDEIEERQLTNFSGTDKDGSYSLSFAMRDHERFEFAALIHRQKAEAKKTAKGGKPDRDPTPPKGTPPMGGGGSTTEFVNTYAIAA